MSLEAWFYTIVSILVISLISLIGVFTLSIKKEKLNSILFFMVSFAVGALFGDTFIHLLPEAIREYGFGIQASLLIILGILLFFVLEKFIHWGHCHVETSKTHPHPVGMMNLVGDGLHNFIDGLLIGASYLVSIPIGLATTLAVLFHEIPQEIGDYGILLHAGFSKGKALLYNFLSALPALLGGIIALILSGRIHGFERIIIPITAGGFIYIAGSDLIPELHKETTPSKSVYQFLGILLGIGIMVLLLMVE